MLLFVLPFLVRGDARRAWAAIAIALTTGTLWSLIHEAIHGLAARDRRINDLLGQAACVVFGAPFDALRAGHLLHHRYSRTVRERTEVYDPARTSRWRAALAYYPRLLGGMYVLEVLGRSPALRRKFEEERFVYDESFARCLARQLRGPLAVPELAAR